MSEKATMLPPLGITSWKEESLSDLTAKIKQNAARILILVDGAAGSGKSTIAKMLAEHLNANLVPTDDVCWNADPVNWDDEMLTGIVNPWLDGNDVSYRPSGWIKENRDGSINVDKNKALIIEGMGATRKTMRDLATFSIWIDTDPEVARNRVIQRDLANGENGGTLESVTEFTDWWDSIVIPSMREEKSWEVVDIIISGMYSDIAIDKLMTYTHI